jgi:hypothetical protein
MNGLIGKVLYEEEHNNYYFYKPKWVIVLFILAPLMLLFNWIYELVYFRKHFIFEYMLIFYYFYNLLPNGTLHGMFWGRLLEVREDGIYIVSHPNRRVRDYVPFDNISKYYIETELRHRSPIVYRNQYGEKRNYGSGVHHVRIEYTNGDVVLLNPKDNEKLLDAIAQAIAMRKLNKPAGGVKGESEAAGS